MTPLTPLRAAILARVSRDEQKKYGYSLPDQIDRARTYCAKRGYTVNEALIFQGDESSKKPVDQRPILTALIDAAIARRVDVVVVLHTSRLTRNQDQHGYLRYVFRQHGARVEYILQEVEDTPMGRAMIGMQSFSDEQEHENIVWRTQNGARAKAKLGRPVGRAQAPFGLRYQAPMLDRYGVPIRATVKAAYEPDPATIEHLRWMFSQYAQGESFRAIARGLDMLGVAPPFAHRGDSRRRETSLPRWSPTTVRLILTSRHYIGEGIEFEDHCIELPDGTETRVKRDLWDGIGDDAGKAIPLPPGVYPQVIDSDIFERVQARIERNHWEHTRETQRSDRDPEIGLLRRGLVRCGHCGSFLGVQRSKGMTIYRCRSNQRRRHGCPDANISTDRLDREVWPWIEAIRSDPRRAASVTERLRHQDDDGGRAKVMLDALDSRIVEIETDRARLVRHLSKLDDEDDVTLVQSEMRRLGDERKSLSAQRERFVEQADAAEQRRQRVERAISVVEGTLPITNSLSYREKRRILTDLGVVVHLHPITAPARWKLQLGCDLAIGLPSGTSINVKTDYFFSSNTRGGDVNMKTPR